MRITTTRLAFLLLLAASAAAQAVPTPFENRATPRESGYFDHRGAAPAVVFDQVVRHEGGEWLRLWFGASTNLPAGSRLRLTSLADGAVQWFDALSLADYAHGSAFFNGDAVRVELLAGPGTRANRVTLASVDVGIPAQTPLTICGPTDDRQLSQDRRGGRQAPTGCTSWLINEFTVLTAGHCTGSSPQMVHFNVPLSTSGGARVNPPPEDQYAYDMPTQRRLDNGVGQDWTVVTVVRNSNTGLYPGQKQGGWYELGTPPANVSGQNIRITGCGSVSSPVSPTWNLVQKTHVGPQVAYSSSRPTAVAYRTDTTGGNSGSPVIHENTGKAIGIHTHGGCSSSNTGQNWGTRIDRTDLQAAIATALLSKTAGRYMPFGTSCTGTAGAPMLANNGFPDVGRKMSVEISGARPSQAGVLYFGLSDTSWPPYTLPLSLGFVGAPGCFQYVSTELVFALSTSAAGTASFAMTMPFDRSLIGATFFNQYLFTDAGANALGVVTTNGAKAVIGD